MSGVNLESTKKENTERDLSNFRVFWCLNDDGLWTNVLLVLVFCCLLSVPMYERRALMVMGGCAVEECKKEETRVP